MSSPDGGAEKPATRGTSEGKWYLWVAGLSFGFLACIPFGHAAQQLRRADVRRWAIAFTVVTASLIVLLALTPDRNPDGTSRCLAISTLGGFSVLAAMVVSILRLRSLRREVFDGVVAAPRALHADPAIAAVLAGRQRRSEARELVQRTARLRVSWASAARTWVAGKTTEAWWTSTAPRPRSCAGVHHRDGAR